MVDDTLGRADGSTGDPAAAPDDVARPDSALTESEARIADRRSTSGVVWQEGAPGQGVIKLRVVTAEGAANERDISVGNATANNHSPSICDHQSRAGRVAGVNVAWVESSVSDTSGTGRIMWQAFRYGTTDAALPPPANDNATRVTDLDGIFAIGSEPTIAGLSSGETLVAWIGPEGHGHGRLFVEGDLDEASGVGGRVDAPEHHAVNAALADLGPVAATPDIDRRLQVVELRLGSFAVMWLALAESGPVLRGNMFLAPAEPASDQDRFRAEYPITELRLPQGFTGRFSVTGSGEDSADLVVTYSERNVATNALEVLARRIDASSTGDRVGLAGPEYLVGSAAPPDGIERAGVRVVTRDGTGAEPETLPSDATARASVRSDGDQGPPATAFTVAAEAGVDEMRPIVKAIDDGFLVAWQTPGAFDGVVQIRMTMYGTLGVPRTVAGGGTAILVTEGAAEHVAPAISALGAGVVVAYVDASGSAAVKAYDKAGVQVGGEEVVDTGRAGAISEIAIGANVAAEEGRDEQDSFAVVYVKDSGKGASDYGNIMLQRYAVAVDGSQPPHLVSLGPDGAQDGGDGPAQLMQDGGSDLSTDVPVVGRSPSVMGLDDGGLAIIWVEEVNAHETIRGSVLEPDGAQVLRIDLTGLLENTGIAKGTKPALLDTTDGDILVAWLQTEGSGGGYVVMAALYDAVAPGIWLEPQQPLRLQAFDSEPDEFSVITSHYGDATFIDVLWVGDSSGSGNALLQRFDIDGNSVGRPTSIAESRAPADEQSLSSDTLAAAGLLDGEIVIVYTEKGARGDADLTAHIIDVSVVDSEDSGNPVPAPTRNAASASALATSDSEEGSAFSTGVDQEIAINVLADETRADLIVSRINQVAITTAAPVNVVSGWVQLREDGSLTVNPDAGYRGAIAFDYTVVDTATGDESSKRVTVNVGAGEPPATLTLVNQVEALAEGIATVADLKVADIELPDDGRGTEGLSLAGLDADMFKIVGTALYLKAGIELDFTAKPTLSVEVLANDDAEADAAASFALSVESTHAAAADGRATDMFTFSPGYGDMRADQQIVDVSSLRFTTFQQLVDAGVLVQAGDDVVITLGPADPADVHTIILKGMELSALTDSDFKF